MQQIAFASAMLFFFFLLNVLHWCVHLLHHSLYIKSRYHWIHHQRIKKKIWSREVNEKLFFTRTPVPLECGATHTDHDFLVPLTSRRFVLPCHEANVILRWGLYARGQSWRGGSSRDGSMSPARAFLRAVEPPWVPDAMFFQTREKKRTF